MSPPAAGTRTPQPQRLQCVDAAWLQQLAHNAVGLLEALLEQQHAAPLPAKCHGRRAAHNARAHNDNVGLVVHPPPLLACVGRPRAGGVGGRRRRRAAGPRVRRGGDARGQRRDLGGEYGEHLGQRAWAC